MNPCHRAYWRCPCQALPGTVEKTVPRHYRSTTACLCPLALVLFCSTFLTTNWMKTQEDVYQCKAQMKLRIDNTKIDRVRILDPISPR